MRIPKRPLIKPSERMRQYQERAAWNRMAGSFTSSAAALRERLAYEVITNSRVDEDVCNPKSALYRAMLDHINLAPAR